MNENLDLTKILDGCPKGTKFYSSDWGEVTFFEVSPHDWDHYPIRLHHPSEVSSRPLITSLTKNGQNYYGYDGECTLFPSKEQRDWSKFERFWDKSKVEKFDPKTLHEWDKILVRKIHSPHNISPWSCEYFSYINPNTPELVNGIASRYEICIPYNDETKHLRGTTDDCPEYYKWWKLEKGFWWEKD